MKGLYKTYKQMNSKFEKKNKVEADKRISNNRSGVKETANEIKNTEISSTETSQLSQKSMQSNYLKIFEASVAESTKYVDERMLEFQRIMHAQDKKMWKNTDNQIMKLSRQIEDLQMKMQYLDMEINQISSILVAMSQCCNVNPSSGNTLSSLLKKWERVRDKKILIKEVAKKSVLYIRKHPEKFTSKGKLKEYPVNMIESNTTRFPYE